MTPFESVLKEIDAIHEKKGRDYGTDDDEFANVRACERFGVPAWLGALLRLNDKITRMQTYAVKGSLANESVEDNLLDMANYAIISLVLFRESAAKKAAEKSVKISDR